MSYPGHSLEMFLHFCREAVSVFYIPADWAHCYIWLIGRTLTGTTSPGQSGFMSNGNKGVLLIPQSSKNKSSPSKNFESYPRHMLPGESYPSLEMQSVYACPYEGVHRSISLMSLSLLLQQCPTYLVHLT